MDEFTAQNLANLGPHPHSQLLAVPVPPGYEDVAPYAAKLVNLPPAERAAKLMDMLQARAQLNPPEAAEAGGTQIGAIGESSRRDFDPDKAGGPMRSLSAEKIKITDKGLSVVARHLSRFVQTPANDAMLRRLEEIVAGRLDSTEYDRRFYAHELREFTRYGRLGWKTGVPTDEQERHELWNNTHTAALEEYGIKDERKELYHPDARRLLEEE